ERAPPRGIEWSHKSLSEPKAPTHDRRPAESGSKSVRPWRAKPIRANIGRIVPARAIRNQAIGLQLRPIVSWSVPCIDDVVGIAIGPHIGHVMDAASRRDSIDFWRNRCSNHPGS